jgi:hypothetical protein
MTRSASRLISCLGGCRRAGPVYRSFRRRAGPKWSVQYGKTEHEGRGGRQVRGNITVNSTLQINGKYPPDTDKSGGGGGAGQTGRIMTCLGFLIHTSHQIYLGEGVRASSSPKPIIAILSHREKRANIAIIYVA